MGSWSVYCGISNITITSGQECVFIPLKKNDNYRGYMPFMPATLPIFGEYDDYGGIENIVKDNNTELIAKHFNCEIEEFCYFLTRGPISDDEDDFPKKLKKIKELKDWTYMWIDRKVYNLLVSNRNKSYGGVGHHDLGNPDILKYLGFTFIGESEKNPVYDPKRYKQIWTFADKTFYSDGTWLMTAKDSIHNIKGYYSSLHKVVKVTEKQLELQNMYAWEMWPHFEDEIKIGELLLGVMGLDRGDLRHKKFMKRYAVVGADTEEKTETLSDKYIDDFKSFGDLLCQLTSIRFNLHCMSHHFAPFVQHLTPQCGEREAHQVILDGFAAINKEYIREGEDIDDEDYDDEDIIDEELTEDESN
jgi:hypothetical protein